MYKTRSFDVLTTSNADRWDETLEEIGEYDFFHLAAFHKLCEMSGEGSPVMPVYREDDHIMAFPLLIRDIELQGNSTGLKDATSVPGLAGPIASSQTPVDVINKFHQELQDYFEQNNIVAVYSRLNPLFNQPELLEGYGEVVEIGITQSIDLTPPPEDQYMRYRRSHKYEIKRLKDKGFICDRSGVEYLDDFIRIYYETMKRLGAEEGYFHDKSYFEYIMREMPDISHLFICRDGENVASAVLCMHCKGIIQLFLAGTTADYIRLSPSKLMYNTVREWGNEIGARVLHMGGSIGGRKDSLYEFKMGFGAQENVYSTWRHIADQKAYEYLCDIAEQQAGEEQNTSYFPKYRNPFLSLAAISWIFAL